MDQLENAILKVRALLIKELGCPEVEIDAMAIPEEFRTLSELAAQFGIGDDGIRQDAIDMMPEDFVVASEKTVSALEPRLSDWINDGEWTNEKNAIVCVKQALSLRISRLELARGVA